nr:PREDICTED: uncharacterized protein LOC105679031 [Linepithema humile]
MEFLIDKINIPTIRAIHEEILPARTCVSFQILDLPPLHIYQETTTKTCACNGSEPQIFKKGKSCLFALPNDILQKPLCNFPVKMSVYKELPPAVLPDVMLIGTHQIQTRDLINSLLSRQFFNIGKTYKTIKNVIKITTATGQCVGEATVFIRASCFGRKIITQFQIPHNRKPYLFKGTDDGPAFQCERFTSASDKERIECACLLKKTGNGSGEAARIRCPVVSHKHRRKEWLEDVKKDKCSPCCRSTQNTVLSSKETAGKCGCILRKREFVVAPEQISSTQHE